MAALLGAHIIKVKPPTDAHRAGRGEEGLREAEDRHHDPADAHRARGAVPASTGAASSCSPAARPRAWTGILAEVRGIHDGGGNGSIIGRNAFQRPSAEALKLLNGIIDIYQVPAG